MTDSMSWWPCRACGSQDSNQVEWSDLSTEDGVTSARMQCKACGADRREAVSHLWEPGAGEGSR
ncbi:hypothetical protein AB0B78_23220 [Streptomyces sp. NPDC040724]|uniref:hypothetical protein n=1 Tax=unclassified Streptomyces TaxID=2593676 RepID=UPI0033FE759C